MGESVGEVVGLAVGDVVGDAVGEIAGEVVGLCVGSKVVGDTDGSEVVGDTEGDTLGTNVVFWQQLPPTLTTFVRGSVEPSAPELDPGCDGWAQDSQGWVLKFPPYVWHLSIPSNMPVM